MKNRSAFALFVLGASVVACSSGGGNVTPNNPLNPTSPPTGLVTTAPATSATPTMPGTTSAPTATATPTAIGATPTAVATSSAGATASPTPTPTATATAGTSGACTTSSAAPASMTYTLNGSAETITFPTYNVFNGSSDVPAQTPSGTVLTLKISQNNFDNVAAQDYGNRTPDEFFTISLSQSTTFGSGSNQLLIPVTITSPCVVAGRTYYVDEYALGSKQYEETDTPTMNGSDSGHIKVSVNPFPGGLTADFIISH